MSSTRMIFRVLGADSGSFNDKDSGEVIKYAALHVEEPIDSKVGVGVKTVKVKAAPEVIGSLAGAKLPATYDCGVEMKTFTVAGRASIDLKIVSATLVK